MARMDDHQEQMRRNMENHHRRMQDDRMMMNHKSEMNKVDYNGMREERSERMSPREHREER